VAIAPLLVLGFGWDQRRVIDENVDRAKLF
jgi:hypothetical protein